MATLPTAWLAPPANLSSSNHSTKIAPIPIAISATIALIVVTTVLILFNRKDKDVFLEDRIANVAETTKSEIISDNVNHRSLQPPIDDPSPLRRPPSVHTKDVGKHLGFENQPKLDAVLGLKDNWDFERSVPTPQLLLAPHRTYFAPSHVDDVSDVDTLKDDEKNSAYVPYPSSEASDDTRGYGHHEPGRGDELKVQEGESVFRRSPLSLVSRTNLEDAY